MELRSPSKAPAASESLRLLWLEPAGAVLLAGWMIAGQQGVETPPLVAATTLIACGAAGTAAWLPVASTIVILGGLAVNAAAGPDVATAAPLIVWLPIVSALGRQTRLASLRSTLLGVMGACTFILIALQDTIIHISGIYFYFIGLVVAVGAGLIWGIAVDGLRRQRRASHARLDRLRLELVRELHDTVAQSLVHIAMDAHVASETPHTPPDVLAVLGRIAHTASSSATDLRELLSALREATSVTEPEPEPEGITSPESLEAEVRTQGRRLADRGFPVAVNVELAPLSAARSALMAKIAREATNNILKHAPQGSPCSLTVVANEIEVTGIFINEVRRVPRTHEGMGIAGMRERLGLLKGTLETACIDGRWTTTVRLPV